MLERFERTLTRGLRIPSDPHPPAGSESSVRVFRAARNYYRFALLRWGLRQVGAVIGIVVVLGLGWNVTDWFSIDPRIAAEVVEDLPRPMVAIGKWLGVLEPTKPTADGSPQVLVVLDSALFAVELFGIGLFLLQLPVTYTLVRLDYKLRLYMVTDRSLRIREGVSSIRETTMTIANIQNIAIRQGPIQRLFRIADLQVRSAGGGSSGSDGHTDDHTDGANDSMHIAYFKGIDNAQELRETLLTRLRSLEDAGLGDTDDVHGTQPAAPVDSARRVLIEARALHCALDIGRKGSAS